MTRAEIRAQMVAMKASMNSLYQINSKAGQCEPKIEMPDEGRLSSMSQTMSKQLTRTFRAQQSSVKTLPTFKGPHIAGFAVDKQHMPVVTNDAHCTNTNNGFSRKPNGGFYFH